MKIDNKLILENSKNLNVLYVEDDDLLRESTSQLFVNFFNKVDTACDGKDGLDKYQNSEYDIVISDINMPNMDGLDMCKKIKEINHDQVIILITAFNETNYLHSAISLGVSGFLTKPIEMEQLKRVLYQTCQVVTDRKLVLEHYHQIEEQNINHIHENDNTRYTCPSDILDELIKNQELISNKWLDAADIHERLGKHQIDVEFFRTHYAINVIDYFLNVIKGEKVAGNCPVIVTMLEFFKNKDLALEDVFIICVNFKNTVTGFIFDNFPFNHRLFDEISFILDRNFEGVIINYLKLKRQAAKKPNDQLIKPTEKKEKVAMSDENFSYSEYVLENDIYELQDLEEEIDALAVLVIMNNNSTVDDNIHLGNQIQRYGTILSNYPLFSNLGAYIVKLGDNFSKNAQLLFDDEERMSSISSLVEGFVNDLIIWRKEIFDNNIKDPDFLNDSFFSNVDTIIMFIEYNESEDEFSDSDDDIFF